MWNWLNCYLSGRHDFGVTCEPGAIFLRCIHCGKRSSGWELRGAQVSLTPAKGKLLEQPAAGPAATVAGVLPFKRRRLADQHRSA
jgi:hypothetical protein